MRLQGARAIVFDFDGTLAPNLDLPDMRRQVIDLTRAARVPDEVFQPHYIVEIIEVAARWLDARDPAAATRYHAAAHRLITEFELSAAQTTQPFPGVRKTLTTLRGAGLAIGVVTRNCEAAVRTVFRDIDDYCDSVLARDNVEHLKPDARHLAAALEALAASGPQAVMVGDGRMDMAIGRELGLYCVGVLSGSSDAPALREAGAHLVVGSTDALCAYL